MVLILADLVTVRAALPNLITPTGLRLIFGSLSLAVPTRQNPLVPAKIPNFSSLDECILL